MLWEFDTVRELDGNGVKARGGTLNGAGPVVAGGMVLVGRDMAGLVRHRASAALPVGGLEVKRVRARARARKYPRRFGRFRILVWAPSPESRVLSLSPESRVPSPSPEPRMEVHFAP